MSIICSTCSTDVPSMFHPLFIHIFVAFIKRFPGLNCHYLYCTRTIVPSMFHPFFPLPPVPLVMRSGSCRPGPRSWLGREPAARGDVAPPHLGEKRLGERATSMEKTYGNTGKTPLCIYIYIYIIYIYIYIMARTGLREHLQENHGF